MKKFKTYEEINMFVIAFFLMIIAFVCIIISATMIIAGVKEWFDSKETDLLGITYSEVKEDKLYRIVCKGE